jgi:hypothetical protein
MNRNRALKALRGEQVDRIPHWEHFSNPRYEEMVTGIDPWARPRSARQALLRALPIDVTGAGGIPVDDTPVPRLPDDQSVYTDADGRLSVRWGTGTTWHWDWGRRFQTIDDVLAYDPMADLDQSQADIVVNYDYRLSAEELARQFQESLDHTRAAAGESALISLGFYNSLFMWPLLTFGWELMLELGAGNKAEMKRLLAAFAYRSRKAFQALALTDVDVITSHDDICYAAGPMFSPAWYREMIFPYYEEFWSYPRAAGIKVIFLSDGNVGPIADDVVACGADGIMSEPYTNWPEIARKHPDIILVGDGDHRALMTEDREAIDAMVKRMATLGRGHPRYYMSLGNHTPWHLSTSSIQAYFDASERYARY